MKVWIDQDLCTGDGLCEEICPAVFTLLDDGLAYVKQGDSVLNEPGGSSQMADVASDLEDAVTEAAEECPGECIFIVTDVSPGARQPADGPDVRNPVCATMRWSGRTERPSMCQVRRSISNVSAMANPLCSSVARSSAVWLIVGRYAEQDPAGCERPFGVGHDLPRLGQVEHDPVEPVLVDPEIDVALQHLVALIRAEKGRDVRLRPLGEVSDGSRSP